MLGEDESNDNNIIYRRGSGRGSRRGEAKSEQGEKERWSEGEEE